MEVNSDVTELRSTPLRKNTSSDTLRNTAMDAGEKISPLLFFTAIRILLAPPKSFWYLRKVPMYSWCSGIILKNPASTFRLDAL
ncbi:hypothetical protein D3C81_1799280 [compost metagenome]